MIVRKKVHARAGLIGNPSDGYFGRTISVILKNFKAEVTVFASPELKIEPNRRDHATFESLHDLIDDIKYLGYFGGIPLIKAAIKKFHEYLHVHNIEHTDSNFTIRYDSDIPIRVGLAGSSAIITAAIQALMEFYDVEIPKPYLPTLVARVESEELGIPVGLQDRVIQTYGGCVYMDFNRDHLEEFGYGRYEEIDLKHLPPLYMAYRDSLSEGTEVAHSDLRERWEKEDPQIRAAMKRFGQITEKFYKALKDADLDEMEALMNENFDLRSEICLISPENWDLINAARNVEACAKFCGSGGAIVGILRSDKMYEDLSASMDEIDAKVIKIET